MNWIYTLLFLLVHSAAFSQTLPANRSVDWTLAGLRDTTTFEFIEIDVLTEGAIGNGTFVNDSIVDQIISSVTAPGAILNFPVGDFLFHNTLNLPSNIIIKGKGAEETTFTFDLSGLGHSISVQGAIISSDTTSFNETATKDSNTVSVIDASSFTVGDWVQIIQFDDDLVTSSWADKGVGQILKISSISNNKIAFDSPFRMDFDINRVPYIVRIDPVKNVGVECLKIHRLDDTAPQQTSSVYFKYAVNSWVNGIESDNCTFSHVQGRQSSNLSISKSYFHHAFGYGGDGRGYGVMLHGTTNECLVENNIFEHLRHSMIVQWGANGNVFAYNYSFDPFWESATTPSNAAGDVVLHGNYTYANLFEQNICQNIVIDDSHGPNGPFNTFLRNRSEYYGIFFSASNSPDQNFLGNDITYDNFPVNIVNYTILGSGHFIHGNNNKGTIQPSGTEILPDSSYAYSQRPDFVPTNQWAGIGTPNNINSNQIPAFDRYDSGTIFSNACGHSTVGISQELLDEELSIFPNPVQTTLTINSSRTINNLRILNSIGQEIYVESDLDFSKLINTENWETGVYFVFLKFENGEAKVEVLVKSN